MTMILRLAARTLLLILVVAILARTSAAADGGPPSAPTGLTAKSGGDAEVGLAWEASPGATHYTVFLSTTQNDTATRQTADHVTTTTYTAAPLHNGTTYYFRVKAVNAAGASGFSDEVSATTAITGPPVPDGVYTLSPRSAPQLRLQAEGAGVSVAKKSLPETRQRWRLTNVHRASYRLSPVDAPDRALTDDGGRIGIADARGRPDQQWILTPTTAGYHLTPADATGQALNATDTIDGAAVDRRTGDGSMAQTWIILTLPEGGPHGWPDPRTAFVPPGYRLVFGDEFDGTAIDTTKWETLAPYSQPHLNDEIECYSPEAVIVRDGLCILRAEETPTRCGENYPWRSGAITSRRTFRQAYYEARIKVPQGQGMWPAFWATSSKRWPPEWDFFEIQNLVGTLYQYMHPTSAAKLTWVQGVLGPSSVYTMAKGMPNPYDGFVIYGCEVTPQGTKLWINGKLTAQWDVSADTTDPMWVSIELAVGGKWAGAPDSTTPRPCDMEIDYIRVYQ